MNEEHKRILLSTLCHGSIFFSSSIISMAIPLAILYTSKDRVVRANAKEALNCHLTIFILFLIIFILIISYGFFLPFNSFSLLTIPILFILTISLFCLGIKSFLLSTIMTLFGVIDVMNKPSIPFRYPGILRLIK